MEAKSDRVTVVFSTIFKDEDDMVIGKMFLQELKEGRRASHTAPQVMFNHREPPLELQDCDAAVGDSIGYITFGTWYIVYLHGSWWLIVIIKTIFLLQYYFLDTRAKKPVAIRSIWYTCSETTCTITSSAVRFIFTREWEPKRVIFWKFSIEPVHSRRIRRRRQLRKYTFCANFLFADVARTQRLWIVSISGNLYNNM